MQNDQLETGVICTTVLMGVGCIMVRNTFPPPFWFVVRFAFLVIVGIVLGYCTYRGTAYIENAVSADDLDRIFNDSFSHRYSICPTTGELCASAKCTPTIMETYGKARAHFLSSYCVTPSVMSFGLYWFLFSASAITLLDIWGTCVGRDLRLWGIIFAVVPIVSYLLFAHFGERKFSCPAKFSDKFPPPEDIGEFNDAMERYCNYLGWCSSVMQAASETYIWFKLISSYISVAMICTALMSI